MIIDKNLKIGVLCGGISSEREISLRSGKNCFDALVRKGYLNTVLIDIKSVSDIQNLKGKIDVAFLITHGKYGEDGYFQSILDSQSIPYTGSSSHASATAMDKWQTKQLAKEIHIPTPNAFVLNNNLKTKSNFKIIWDELSAKNKAVFLKPVSDGSSVNTYKIKSSNELEEKVNSLDLKQANYLLEEYIAGREITVSIIESDGKLKALPILELKPKNEFYDYEAKYTKGLTEFVLPAKIQEDLKLTIEEHSKNIFSKIGLSGFARVDYILSDEGTAYLLEVNSLPGMTDTSDLPAQAAYAGIKYDDLVEIILQTARLHS